MARSRLLGGTATTLIVPVSACRVSPRRRALVFEKLAVFYLKVAVFRFPKRNLVVAVTASLSQSSQGGAPSPQVSLAADTVLNSFVLPAALRQ